MAGIGNTLLDLIDLEKSLNPDGSMADVIEMLREMNPMLMDAYMVECNNGTTHRHTIRTGLPTVTWGKLYQGIPQSKSTKAQVTDSTGFVEGLSTVDTRLLKLAGDKAAAMRLQEAEAYLESMAQELQQTMIYGNDTTAPEEFMGLAPRFNDTTAGNGSQIIDAGGVGADNTSIWMITWGPKAVHGLYPKGTKAGIDREDKGEQRTLDADGNAYYVKEEMFTQHMGLAVADWRYVVRIANIDVSAMQADPSNIDGVGGSLYDYMRKGYYAHEGRRTPMNQSRTVIYCNSDVLEALDALGTNAGANDNYVRLGKKEVQGEEVLTYRQFMLRETDALLNTEAVVS